MAAVEAALFLCCRDPYALSIAVGAVESLIARSRMSHVAAIYFSHDGSFHDGICRRCVLSSRRMFMTHILIIVLGTSMLYVFAVSRIEAYVKILALQGFLLFLLVSSISRKSTG